MSAMRLPVDTTVVRAVARRGDRVLLLRRAADDALGGCWELPGGKADRLPGGGYESPVLALRREVHEESGLELSGLELLGQAQRVSPRGRPFHELTFLGSADAEPRLSSEHDAVCWHRPGAPLPGPLTEAAADALGRLAA
jgi:8-oxo-dGTP diphosphatase